MKKILLITCIFLSFKCTTSYTDKFNKNHLLSHIDIYFSYNPQFGDIMNFSVFDSVQVDSVNIETYEMLKFSKIPHNKYLEFLAEIKRIKCIKDSSDKKELFITIYINEPGAIIERYRLKSNSQIREYISISNRILGDKNFIPKMFYEDNLKR